MNEHDELYSTVDRLSGEARSRFAAVTNGTGILTAIVLLSGVLSALFFWENSTLVFTNVWPPLALVLGLAVGLIPAEGAFFGWKRIRETKADMTNKQLTATTWGLVVSIISSIFSTFGLYIVSFPYVPAEILAYDAWFVFLALALPIISQVCIYAWFAVNERRVVENHENAKLGAMGFDAYIHNEQARIMAIIKGAEAELNQRLDEYGRIKGSEQAARQLQTGRQELLRMGNNRTRVLPDDSATRQPLVEPQEVAGQGRHANGANPM